MEVLEDFEGAEVEAVGTINAPLNAGKGIEGAVIGLAERGIVLDGFVDVLAVGEGLVQAFDAIFPEVGFDAAEAALGPLGGDQGIDERELGSASGMVFEVECRGEAAVRRVFVVEMIRIGRRCRFQGGGRRFAFEELPSVLLIQPLRGRFFFDGHQLVAELLSLPFELRFEPPRAASRSAQSVASYRLAFSPSCRR